MKKKKEREEPVFLVACSYCDKKFNKAKQNIPADKTEDTSAPLFISHGTCPECLLKNFPKEYLRIQKDSRLRIKSVFKRKYKEIFPTTAN